MDRRTEIFIDWLSYTSDIPTELHSRVREGLEELCEARLAFRVMHDEMLQSYGRMYRIGLEGTNADIQIEPRDSDDSERIQGSRRFLRVEYNPHAAARNFAGATVYLNNILAGLIGGWSTERLMCSSFLTRLDLTFDVDSQIDRYLVFTTLRRTLSDLWRYEQTGALNGIVIGSKDSRQQLRVYDKRLELWQATALRERRSSLGSTRIGNVIRRVPPRTRFELRLRQCGYVQDFLGGGNPFESYTVRYHRFADPSIPEYMAMHFLDSVKQRGAQAALSLIPDQFIRTRYRNALIAGDAPPWWNAGELWAELPLALQEVFA